MCTSVWPTMRKNPASQSDLAKNCTYCTVCFTKHLYTKMNDVAYIDVQLLSLPKLGSAFTLSQFILNYRPYHLQKNSSNEICSTDKISIIAWHCLFIYCVKNKACVYRCIVGNYALNANIYGQELEKNGLHFCRGEEVAYVCEL